MGLSSVPMQLAAVALCAAGTAAIVMPDGHTGRVPSLGWNSWNAYHCDITEAKFLDAANALVSSGLRDAGYNYVNIDDCWSEETGRDSNGELVPNATRFPNGIKGLADTVHGMNLSLGIYSTAGSKTCAGYPASLEYEDTDAKSFSDWGVDYLKYDNCNIPSNWTDQYVACDPDYQATTSNGSCTQQLDPNLAPAGYDWSKSNSAIRFNRMRDALAKQEREIVLSLCIWGTADVFSWGNQTGVSWRMSNDIEPDWKDVTRILNENSFRLYATDFWGHNDADMLEVGNGLSAEESRTHFALWAAMKSPLLIGTDLTTLSQDDINLLKNKYLLAFNQDDTYGAPAKPYKWGTNPDYTFNSSYPAEYWSGASKAGTLVLMTNTGDANQTKEAVWSEVPQLKSTCSYKAMDVWTGNDLGCLSSYSANLASHDTAAILVTDEC